MTKKDYYLKADALAAELADVDFNNMPLSSYNKGYINRLKKAFRYNFRIYAECFYRITKKNKKKPENITLIDFGGGSGFLSILAKKCGFKSVIYVDLNPLSVQAITYLKSYFQTGPDVILEGSSDILLKWAQKNEVSPDCLISTDLIEHVYDLNCFFSELTLINPQLEMLFTTGSNPYNPVKKRHLKKLITGAESGNLENPNYLTLRLRHIQQAYPSWSEEKQRLWAEKSRGLIYEDIDKAAILNQLPQPIDGYNTCDPRNGSWEERILPVSKYKKMVHPYNFSIDVYSGYYYTDGAISLKKLFLKFLNVIIKITGKLGLVISPLMYLHIKRN